MFQRKNLWIIHVLGWLVFLILPLTIMSREPDPYIQITLIKSGSFWLFFLLYSCVFYLNSLFFIPQLFLKQKYVQYTGLFLMGFLLIFYTQPFENLIFQKFHAPEGQHFPMKSGMFRQPPPEGFIPGTLPPPPVRNRADRPTVDFVSLVLFVVVWVVSMATVISEQWRISEKRFILSEANKAQAELSFFKAQIHPHFLFNTLNNIYSLAVSNSENTAPSILKLSQMMRYITEEATEDFVPLKDEIECLENYIDLQKLRLSPKTSVNFRFEGDYRNIRIAPLILMTFVENAFKYGVSNRFASLIEIKARNTENRILFFCKNQIFETDIENERQGIGIANTQKRLNFLYPDNYELEIRNENNVFEINLELRNVNTDS